MVRVRMSGEGESGKGECLSVGRCVVGMSGEGVW